MTLVKNDEEKNIKINKMSAVVKCKIKKLDKKVLERLNSRDSEVSVLHHSDVGDRCNYQAECPICSIFVWLFCQKADELVAFWSAGFTWTFL